MIKVADIETFCTGQAGVGGAGCDAAQLVQSLRLGPDGTSEVVFVQGLAGGEYDLAGVPLAPGSPAAAGGDSSAGGKGSTSSGGGVGTAGGGGGGGAGQNGASGQAGSVDPCESVLCSEDCEDSCGWCVV